MRKILSLLLLFSTPALAQVSPAHVIVGYWQDWGATTDSPPYIPLHSVDSRYNVIECAFTNTAADNATLSFVPNSAVSDFTADVATLQSQGRKVLVSIGGENGTLILTSAAQKQSFITSLESILDQYNFDGFDLDLEGGTTLQLDNGDNNFMSPTTAKVVNLISACQQVIAYRQAKGKNCWLTMAPETFYVQTAFGSSYSPLVGAQLPIIYGLRNQLTILQVQLYNTGTVEGLDGNIYGEATADFIVAMTEMLMTGFPVSGTTQTFPALRPDQIAVGLPATAGAGGGFTSAATVNQALNYLVKGIPYGGTYKLRNPAGYPGLRGTMDWSINWDESGGNAFVSNVYNFFFGNTSTAAAPKVSITAPATGASFIAPASVTIQATASDSGGTVSSVAFYNGGTLLGTSTASPYSFSWTNVAGGTYSLTAIATNNSGLSTTSSAVSITVKDTSSSGGGSCSGVAAWNASTAYNGGAQVVYNGSLYSAKWWTQGNEPDISTGDGQPWQLVSACSGPITNQPPTVSITSPATGAGFTAPASVTIQATAADPDGTVARVQFFNGATLLGSATTAPYSFAWSNVAAGTYSLTAVATDNAGASTTSAAVSITVSGSGNGGTGGNCAGIPTYQPYPAIYNQGDEVVYHDSLYQSTSDNLYNVTPGTASWWWAPLGTCATASTAKMQNGSAALPAAPVNVPLTVFPNPATGSQVQVQVSTQTGEHLLIEVGSVSGSAPVLRQEWVAPGQGPQLIRLDLTGLSSGVWILKVSHPATGRIETAKILRLH